MLTDAVTLETSRELDADFAGSRISAIVPARNEERVIADCVAALSDQPEIAEIIVVNDGSVDRTAEVVRGLMATIPELGLLNVEEPPPGWIGKNNAAWHGAKAAKNRWLLFTDADAEVQPAAAGRALGIAEESAAALVSFSPEQVLEGWYEKALIPFVYCRLARYFSYEAVNDPGSRVAAANGQFLMIRRDAYEAIGGHARIASAVLEDVALARLAKAAGYQLWFGSGKDLVRTRMYRSFDAMCEGWKKNLYLLIGGTPGWFYRELLAVVPGIPLLLLIVGMKLPFALLLGLGLLAARHASYGLELARNGYGSSYIIHYVPAVTLYAAVLWASYRAHSKGLVQWKGRQIAVGLRGELRRNSG